MLKAVLNFPVDASSIGNLVRDPSDLQLMMPTAEIPFNSAQWQEKLETNHDSLSFFVYAKKVCVGHFAFLRISRERKLATLGLVYLTPDCRGKGLSKNLIQLSEETAQKSLDLENVLLNVRTFNLPAYHLYLKMGYVEYERTDDMVRMQKTL